NYIKRVVTQGSIDNIHPNTIGEFSSNLPINFFNSALLGYIFRNSQNVRCTGSSSNKTVDLQSCHDRKDVSSMRTSLINFIVVFYKVFGCYYSVVIKERIEYSNILGMGKTAIEYGNPFAFAAKT